MLKINNQQGSATIIILIVVAILAVGGTAAYFVTDGFGSNKSNQSNQANQSSNSDVVKKTIEDNKPTEESKSNKEKPKNMPSDMPVYSPAEILTSSDKDNGGFRFGLNTPDSEEQVIQWYLSELSAKGWDAQRSKQMDIMISVKKGDLAGSITIKESKTTNTGTTISYLINGKK